MVENNQFKLAFIESAGDGVEITTEGQWNAFVRNVLERGLVLDSELLFLESIWLNKAQHANAFGRKRPVCITFLEFEEELLRQFTSPSAAGIETEIKGMEAQVDSVAAMVDEWDYKTMDDRDLRRVLVTTEQLADAHADLLQKCRDCIKVHRWLHGFYSRCHFFY
jgi:hypothetical protein